MDRNKERQVLLPLAPQSRRPRTLEKRRTSIWIRPHDVRTLLVELRVLAYYYLSPPRLPKWRGILRFGADLLGIVIGLGFIFFLVMQTVILPSLIQTQSAPLIAGCIAIQGCDRVAAPPEASTSQPSTYVSPVAKLIPLSSPTPILVPSPTLSPTPTPSIAILRVVPSNLTVSYSHVCAIKAPVLIELKNIGGAALLWSQDKDNTSPGIRIVDPTKAYLLQPGQSVTANAFCSPGNNKGHYKLLILYNGGEVMIPVTVAD